MSDLLKTSDGDSAIKEGGPRFKRRFAEIARSGMRLISNDQNSLRMHEEQLRADARAESNKAMLLQLQSIALQQSLLDDTATSISNIEASDLEGTKLGDVSRVSTGVGLSSNLRNYVTGTELEFKVTMSRNIELQAGSLAFEKSSSRRFHMKEAELTRVAVASIEEREAEILKLKLEVNKIHRQYIEADHGTDFGYSLDLLTTAKACMSRVQMASVAVAEAIGAWLRLVLDERKTKRASGGMTSVDPRVGREYCVVIAVKGPTLYPQSLPMHSGMRRFCRAAEPRRSAINIKYVGVFREKDAAVKAFQKASAAVPLELRPQAYADAPKMMIGLRACGRHYLVRSESVPPSLPCQECVVKEYCEPSTIVPSISDELLPQFLWHGENYLDRMWSDLDFLDEVVPLKKHLMDTDLKMNPLLLPRAALKRLLTEANQGTKGSDALGMLTTLTGRIEQVENAKQAADEANKIKAEPSLCGLPYASPHKVSRAERFHPNTPMDPMLSSSALTTSMDNNASTRNRTDSMQDFDDKSISLVSISSTRSSTYSADVSLQYDRNNRAVSRSTIDDLPVNLHRAVRALWILGQATAAKSHKLLQNITADEGRDSSTRRKTNRSTIKMSSSASFLPSVGHAASRELVATSKSTSDMKNKIKDTEIDDDGQQLIPVIASYDYLGAKLSTLQMRKPLADRIEHVWCRTDAGEWQGLSKRTEMKVYESREKGLTVARKRANERRRAQAEIRASIKKHFADSDPEKIKINLVKAEGIRGSVLGLDIINARKYLARREKTNFYITLLQAAARGFTTRRKINRIRDKLREDTRKRHLLEESCADLARSFVRNLMSHCVKLVGRQTFNHSFAKIANLTGFRMVVTVHRRTRYGTKSRKLCKSCQISDFSNIYDFQKHRFFRGRAACTCDWIHQRENWLVQGYDPLDCSSPGICLDESILRERLDLMHSMSLITSEEHAQSRVGKSYGVWAPLLINMPIPVNSFARRIIEAAKKAREEMASLALLPRTYTDNLMQAVRSQTPLPIEYFHKYQYKSTSGPLIVKDPQSESEDNSFTGFHWEPLLDVIIAQRRIASLQRDLEILLGHTATAEELLANEIAITNHIRTEVLERSYMELEDADESLRRTLAAFDIAKTKVTSLIAHSALMRATIEAEEKNQIENHSLSWDPVEDALSSEAIVNRRLLEIQKKSHMSLYKKYTAALNDVIKQYKYQRNLVRKMRKDVKVKHDSAKKLRLKIKEAEQVALEVRRMAREAFEDIVTTLAVPLHNSVPLKRKMKILNYRLAYQRDPCIRALKQNRLAWSAIFRQTTCLSSIRGPVVWSSHSRYVVTVYLDPVTSFLIVQVGQGDAGVEEMLLHKDFRLCRRRYSDLTSHVEQHEILLRSEDVDSLFRYPAEWPLNIWNDTPPIIQPRRLSTVHNVRGNISVAASASVPVSPRQDVQASDSKDGIVDNPDDAVDIQDDLRLNIVTRPLSPPALMANKPEVSLPLDGIKVWRTYSDKWQSLPPTYYQRRLHNQSRQKERCMKIVSYLRLHPHSGRPCLGRLHFIRRSRVTNTALRKSMWYQDLKIFTPSTWTNELFTSERFVSQRPIYVAVRESWGEFEVKLTLMRGASVSVVASFLDVIKSFSYHPLMFCCLLNEVVVNVYSSDTIERIISHVDLCLPGEDMRWWRLPLQGEIPKCRYLSCGRDRYRGPVYSTHRILSGKYFLTRFFLAAGGDLLIEFGPPRHSTFWRHEYDGKIISVEISIDELRALGIKISSNPRLVSKKLLNTLNLLRSEYWDVFYSIILDLIVFDLSKFGDFPSSDSSIQDQDLKQSTSNDISNEDQQEDVGDIVLESEAPSWKDCLKTRFDDALSLYDSWIKKRSSPMEDVGADIVSQAALSLQSLSCTPAWQIGLEKTPFVTKMLLVYEGVYLYGDTTRANAMLQEQSHVQGPGQRAKASRAMRLKEQRYGDERRKHSNTVSHLFILQNSKSEVLDHHYFHPIGYNHQSMWHTKIYVDERKLSLCIRVNQADSSKGLIERKINMIECELMQAEDLYSQHQDRLFVIESIKRNISMDIANLERKVSSKVQDLKYLTNKITGTKNAAEKLVQKLYATVDYTLLKKGLDMYQVARESMKLASDDIFQLESFGMNTSDGKEPSENRLQSSNISQSDSMAKYFSLDGAKFLAWMESLRTRVLKNSETEESLCRLYSQKKGYGARARPGNISIIAPLDNTSAKTSASCRHCTSGSCRIHNYCQATFRRPKSWARVKPSQEWKSSYSKSIQESASRTVTLPHAVPKYWKTKSRLFLLSEPNIGPCSLVSLHIYEPGSRQQWTLLIGSAKRQFNSAGLWDANVSDPHRTSKKGIEGRALSVSMDAGKRFSTMDQGGIYTCVAHEFVWSVMMKGFVSAATKLFSSRLDQSCEDLKNSIITDTLTLREHRSSASSLQNINNSELHKLHLKYCKRTFYAGETPSPSIFGGVTVYGLWIPVNENEVVTPIQVSSSQWFKNIRLLLRSDDIIATRSIPGMLYGSGTNKASQLDNLRLKEWMIEYSKNIGWRKGMACIRLRSLMRKELHHGHVVESPLCKGNIAIMLRHGLTDFMQLKKWCDDRYKARLEEEARRKEADALRQRKIREAYAAFRAAVFELAERYLWAFESLSGYVPRPLTDVDGVERHANTAQARILVAQALGKLDTSEFRGRFLIDGDVGLVADDAGDYFETAVVPSSFAFLTDDTYDDSAEVVPRAVEVFYAVYQLHCFGCQRAPSFCTVLGCGMVRGWAMTMQQQMEEKGLYLRGRKVDSIDEFRGSGKHPMEVCLRRFLLGNSFSSDKLFRQLSNLRKNSTVVQMKKDLLNVQIINNVSKRLFYRNLIIESGQSRYIHRRLIRPNLIAALKADEVLEAKGGDWEKDELSLPYHAIDSISPAIPPPLNIESESSYDSQSDNEDGGMDPTSLILPEAIFHVPVSLVKFLLGLGNDARGHSIPSWAVDPYPARPLSAGNDALRQPMSVDLFNWITRRLHVYRYVPKVEKGDEAGTQAKHRPKLGLKFDRMHCESVVYLADGTTVLIQLLHGVLVGESCEAMQGNLCPPAAIRYLATADMMRLCPGLTLLCYDKISNTSKAMFLQEKLLSRISRYLNVDDTDMARLCSAFAVSASELLRIVRMGNSFISMDIDSKIFGETGGNAIFSSKGGKRTGKYFAKIGSRGRREIAVDNRNSTLEAARIFLKSSHL